MRGSTLLALLLIAAVAAIALWLRRQGESAPMAGPAPPPPGSDVLPGLEDDEELEWEAGDAAAVTVDGIAFVGEEHGVALVPTPDPMAPAPKAILPMEFLRPGDFTGARLVRGAPSLDPWRLELLGQDGEYVSYAFAGEEAARCALDLLETRSVMRYVHDEQGRPLAPSTEQFEEARRRHDETERLLALGEDADGGQPLH